MILMDVRGFEVSKVCILENPRGWKLRNAKNDEKRGFPGPKRRSRAPLSPATLGAFGPLLARFPADSSFFPSLFSYVFFLTFFFIYWLDFLVENLMRTLAIWVCKVSNFLGKPKTLSRKVVDFQSEVETGSNNVRMT